MNVPIQALDVIDIVGRRKDGGADLVIVCSGPLDDSPATLSALSTKLMNYLRAANSAELVHTYRLSPEARIAVYISCAFPIDAAALAVVENFRSSQAGKPIEINVVDRME